MVSLPRRLGRKRRTMRGSDDVPEQPADAPEYLSINQLAEHEDAIRDWLEADPDMGKKILARKLLSEKGVHVNPKTAENYLTRLKRPAETPRRRDRRAMRGSSSAVGDVTGLRKLGGSQLDPYKPAVRQSFEDKPSTTHDDVRTILAKAGVTASKADVQNLWRSMKLEHWASKAGDFKPMVRKRFKQAPVPCTIGHKDFHQVELLLRQHLARKPSMSVNELLAGLTAHGYVIAEETAVRMRGSAARVFLSDQKHVWSWDAKLPTATVTVAVAVAVAGLLLWLWLWQWLWLRL